MLDKELLKLIGWNKKHIAYVVVLSIIGLLANLAITASICYVVNLAIITADGMLESLYRKRSRRKIGWQRTRQRVFQMIKQ